jgi:hypothetical protein
MNKWQGFVFGIGTVLLWQGGLMAQSNTTPPPKVLMITREFLKPGRAGEVHKRAESAFVQAMATAKWPTHYVALTSLSGRPRALFFTRYDSFADWEKDNAAVEKNASLSAALDRAAMNDGDLLSDMDGGAFLFREDYSMNPAVDIAHMRYVQISHYQIKPGHSRDWEEAVKLVRKAYAKMNDVHFAVYQGIYGGKQGSYLFLTPMKSAAEVDAHIAARKDFEAAMGEDGMKQLGELAAACIEGSESNIFAFDPAMSYAPPEWIKEDPEFWKPKAAKAAMKKPGDKSPMAEPKTPQ